ncbi:MAG: tRNA lysidine(34) synthetase TilS [Bacilli bacterium]
MKEKILRSLEKYGIKDNEIIVVGVSGGPDSLTLLALLVELRKKISYSLVCAHVNHNVRSVSAKEKIFVEEWCKQHEVIFESMTIEAYGDDNFHNEARNIRYQFFEDLVNKYQAHYLMTAHHGDDLIETVLMRLTRGSTLKGYSGFSEVVQKNNYKLVRPLISFTKQEILDYAKKNKIPFVTDKSNSKPKYTRNRYRKEILPFFKKEDPHVHEKFLKFSRLLEEYDEYIDLQTKKVFSKVYKDSILYIPNYLELDGLLQMRVIYEILESVYQDDLMLINDSHVHLIQELICSKKSNSFIYLPNNIKVTKSYDEVTVALEVGDVTNYEIELIDYAILPNGKHLEVIDTSDNNGNDICRLDSKEISLPLYVRTRKHGDKMEMKGTIGHRKVKDIMIDKKIALRDRELWPIVVDSKDVIVWIPGLKKSKFNKQKSDKCDILIKYY